MYVTPFHRSSPRAASVCTDPARLWLPQSKHRSDAVIRGVEIEKVLKDHGVRLGAYQLVKLLSTARAWRVGGVWALRVLYLTHLWWGCNRTARGRWRG